MPEKKTTHEWMRTVLEEHRQLRAMIGDLRAFLEAPRPAVGEKGAHTWSTELTSRLVKLHDALYRHFQEEEEGGMMEELMEAHPRATGAVEELVHDHEQILKDFRRCTTGAMEYADGVEPREPRLRRSITEILDCLHRHEVEETDLIQRLEYEMVGAAD